MSKSSEQEERKIAFFSLFIFIWSNGISHHYNRYHDTGQYTKQPMANAKKDKLNFYQRKYKLYDKYKIFPQSYVLPPWRNGLACWTSNSKVVGSSPTGGGFFLLLNYHFVLLTTRMVDFIGVILWYFGNSTTGILRKFKENF